MFILTLDVWAQTASFRIPEQHTFQPTLPLPPITTLIGLMGAALGLAFDEAIAFKKKHAIAFGVIGSHTGEMRDLWKYIKIKENETLRDVLIREYVTDFTATIAIGALLEAVMDTIESAFHSPTYALTLGTSDDLVKLRRISGVVLAEECLHADFENTVLSGDKTALYEPTIDLRETPVSYTIRAPQVFLLPTDFTFTGDARRISRRELFTFVGSPITLKEPIRAYHVNGNRFEMLQ
jgi:CRISPR-associated protein Cas5t